MKSADRDERRARVKGLLLSLLYSALGSVGAALLFTPPTVPASKLQIAVFGVVGVARNIPATYGAGDFYDISTFPTEASGSQSETSRAREWGRA